MRYRFTVHELLGLNMFLDQAVKYLQTIASEALRLRVTPDTAQSRLIIDSIVSQLHTLKEQSSFWGLMEMMMLIRQAQSILAAMGCGRLEIDAMAVDVLLDIKNILGDMVRELSEASAKLQETEELEIELVCALEAQWLIGFIRQLLHKKLSTALVPQEVVSNTSIRVSEEKIQQFLTMIGELTTNNHIFSQLARILMMEHKLPKLSREVTIAGQFIKDTAAELEKAVMSMGNLALRPTLLGSRGLLVQVAGQLLIFPLDHVIETLKVNYDRLVIRLGRQMLYHRGETLGILPLAEVLDMAKGKSGDAALIVVVTNGQDKVGILVEKVLTEQKILIKPLPDYLSNIVGIGGATIIGDGKVALVLNIRELIEKAREYKALV